MVSMALGAGSQALCAYPCWTDEYRGRTYNTNRIWGRIGTLSGVQEGAGRLISGPSATIVRGVLELAGDRRPGTKNQTVLLNIAGQKIMDLTPGANDVSRVSPGVYFVREPGTQAQTSRKVVITR
jgi:hypothetical protein